jgi:hypothetical protein
LARNSLSADEYKRIVAASSFGRNELASPRA